MFWRKPQKKSERSKVRGLMAFLPCKQFSRFMSAPSDMGKSGQRWLPKSLDHGEGFF